jgi:3',5'-cyclic AMP phosphodiesterase CpdA
MRNIKNILCGLYTLAAIFFAASVSAQTQSYTKDNVTIKIGEIEIEAGIEKPFSVLHVSDSHLVYADERDTERKAKLAAKRAKKMRNSEAVLNVHRQYAMENNLMIVHSGDMMDFVSEANLDVAKRIFSQGDWLVAVGNHDFSLYVGEAKEDDAYRAQSYDKVQAVYPNDLTFYSKVVNGVNFVALDNGYFNITKEQFAKMKAEVKRGLPIILVCHNPLYTPELRELIQKGDKSKATGMVGAPLEVTEAYYHKERPAGEEWRNRNVQQRADKTTLKFCKWLKKQDELKAILCGHVHINSATQFSPTAKQYSVRAGFRGACNLVHIK